MHNELVHEEEITSRITRALFIVLALVFTGLFAWRVTATSLGAWAWIFLFFAVFFLFYVLNYRRLLVRITANTVHLRFGIFRWTIPFENIRDCSLDEVAFTRLGGAGIHFAMVGGRYRANFNFLDQPRVLLHLKQKQGLVWDVSFSTRQPEFVMGLIRERAGVTPMANAP